MGVKKVFKLSVLPLVLAGTQASATTISNYLDQSNDLLDCGGFGKFGFQLLGNGDSRTELLNFSITGVVDDTINSYAMDSTLRPAAVEFFATHITGFDAINGVTSAQFAGSTVVTVPAAVMLFGIVLIALAGFVRLKHRV